MAADQRTTLLEQYHVALQNYLFEGQAFWTRITAFVLLNSALLVARGALSATRGTSVARGGVEILGFVSTLLWAHTAIRAHYLIDFWLAMLRDLEIRLGLDEGSPFGLRESFLNGKPMGLPTRSDMRLPWLARGNINDTTSATLTIVFLAIWIAAIVHGA